MSDNHDGGAPPAPAPKNATRVMMIVLAALVVVALLAWFLLGTHRAPGPAADENVKPQTETAFEDTVIVNPDGTATQQVTPNDTLNPAEGVINAPPIADAPPATNTAQ